jgi:hypothetical protein
MGLCKCRNVTNLFCFEHRKNVCEICLLESHPECSVKSYLSWLQDSDYHTNCILCEMPLTGHSIRLKCLDLFHTACLDDYAKKLPKTTTLLGYTCPGCKDEFIPSRNDNSLISIQIRQKLKDFKWFSDCQVFDNSTVNSVLILESC